MVQLIVFTALWLGPVYALLMGLVYLARLVLPEGQVLYEQVEEYLWAPAGLLALALAGLVTALIRPS